MKVQTAQIHQANAEFKTVLAYFGVDIDVLEKLPNEITFIPNHHEENCKLGEITLCNFYNLDSTKTAASLISYLYTPFLGKIHNSWDSTLTSIKGDHKLENHSITTQGTTFQGTAVNSQPKFPLVLIVGGNASQISEIRFEAKNESSKEYSYVVPPRALSSRETWIFDLDEDAGVLWMKDQSHHGWKRVFSGVARGEYHFKVEIEKGNSDFTFGS